MTNPSKSGDTGSDWRCLQEEEAFHLHAATAVGRLAAPHIVQALLGRPGEMGRPATGRVVVRSSSEVGC